MKDGIAEIAFWIFLTEAPMEFGPIVRQYVRVPSFLLSGLKANGLSRLMLSMCSLI